MVFTTITAVFNSTNGTYTHITSVSQIFAYTLLLPYVAFGLIILAIGIGCATTKEARIGLFAGLITSLLMFSYAPNIVPVIYIITTFSVLVGMLGVDIMLKRASNHKNNTEHAQHAHKGKV